MTLVHVQLLTQVLVCNKHGLQQSSLQLLSSYHMYAFQGPPTDLETQLSASCYTKYWCHNILISECYCDS